MEKYIPDKKQIFVTEEFLEAVDDFVLSATNERDYYKLVSNWFKGNKKLKQGLYGFPVANGISSLVPLLNKIRALNFGMHGASSEDKRTFVQTMLYLHYVAEFVPEYKHLRITDFYEIRRDKPEKYDPFSDTEWEPPKSTESALLEAEANIEKAQQHFKNVENTMNTLEKYKDKASAQVHLIHGRPVETYTESELMALIREAQKNKEAIADLVETSERMKAKSAQYDADIAVYVTALDALN